MEKCKTCVYWMGNDTSNMAKCEMIDMWDGNPVIINVDVSDDSGLNVSFLTSPEFGCSLHKAKEL